MHGSFVSLGTSSGIGKCNLGISFITTLKYTTTKIVYYDAPKTMIGKNCLWKVSGASVVIKFINNKDGFWITVLRLWV